MKIRLSLLSLGLLLLSSIAVQAQKKVAVVSFFCDKYIGTDQLDGGASVIGLVAKLSDNPDFNLRPALEDFHQTFFNEYSSQFTFQLEDEETVKNNEKYKAFTSDFKGLNIMGSGDPDQRFETIDGYKRFFELFTLKKKDIAAEVLEFFPDVDGIMFVYLDYEFLPKVAVGGMGTAGIKAYVNMRMYNREGKKVFNIREGGTSKNSVAMVRGIPIMKPAEITPLCLNATEKLVKDLNKKIGKISSKADKKL